MAVVQHASAFKAVLLLVHVFTDLSDPAFGGGFWFCFSPPTIVKHVKSHRVNILKRQDGPFAQQPRCAPRDPKFSVHDPTPAGSETDQSDNPAGEAFAFCTRAPHLCASVHVLVHGPLRGRVRQAGRAKPDDL
jgi:hypothetical protein